MEDIRKKLSDDEFNAALRSLEEGRVPFSAPEMLRRLGQTIVAKLWDVEGEKDQAQASS